MRQRIAATGSPQIAEDRVESILADEILRLDPGAGIWCRREEVSWQPEVERAFAARATPEPVET
jgi:hypothetical protein